MLSLIHKVRKEGVKYEYELQRANICMGGGHFVIII